MYTYIAILRGINVGGKRKMLMVDLKNIFLELSFDAVKTYIQSGNVVFSCQQEVDTTKLAKIIEITVYEQYGFEVPVQILSAAEIKNAVEVNPYFKENAEVNHLHLTFLNDKPNEELVEALLKNDFGRDSCIVRHNFVFIHCEGKYHKSKLTNNFLERKLKVKATTRNWKTVLKLHELSHEDS